MILLGSGILNKALIFYWESTDDSNIFGISVEFYEAWNKPEKAEE
jgi:hypothetical protein